MSALYHLMVKTRMLLAKGQYFGSFLVEIGEFDPHPWVNTIVVDRMFGIFQGVKSVKNYFFNNFFDKTLPFNPPPVVFYQFIASISSHKHYLLVQVYQSTHLEFSKISF